MNPQEHFGFPTVGRQNRSISNSESSKRLQAIAELRTAMAVREEHSAISQLQNQARMASLPTSLPPVIDIAALQQRLAFQEGNRRHRMSLQTQIDNLSRSNSGFPKPRMPENDAGGLKSQGGHMIPSAPPTAKRMKLGTVVSHASSRNGESSETMIPISNAASTSLGSQFPLPPLIHGETRPIFGPKLKAFRPAWGAFYDKSSRLDSSVTAEERMVMVKESFGKAIQLDNILLYSSPTPQPKPLVDW